MLRYIVRRAFWGVIVLLLVIFVSFVTQDLAHYTRAGIRVSTTDLLIEAGTDAVRFIWRLAQGDLGSYTKRSGIFGTLSTQQIGGLVGPFLVRSLALLALALLVGGLVGGSIGLLAALWRRPAASLVLILASMVGVSTPSFLLGVLLQFLEITLYRRTGTTFLPVGGFGWDAHLVLPTLVLAARPVAQVARLTHAEASRVLDEDYVRTAHSKGLGSWRVTFGHVMPNVAATILTALGTSLAFALSSLPVVEYLFGWPGMGRAMLEMLRTYQREGATALILAMGAVFVVVHIGLDIAFRLIDPRLREPSLAARTGGRLTDWLAGLFESLIRILSPVRWRDRRRQRARTSRATHALPRAVATNGSAAEEARLRRRERWRNWRRAVVGNPALILGLMIGIAMAMIVVWGPRLALHNVYSSTGLLVINGRQVLPPVPPSDLYPLGTDAQGRDILSLLLVGARRTFSMALFAMAARLAIGGLLGFLAGWFAGSRLDRVITALAEVVDAFPALLLAMLIVYGMGIEQGITPFVVALAIIGWGGVMHTIRGQVMSIKPMAYIESAVASGLTQARILGSHVLPNVWPVLLSLGFLEMGGALMILGELGFLGVFIGGGISASGDALPTLVYYDIPEWSVMLANSWKGFRSFPWATLYPALSFFAAILGFTFLGEGLRWLSERLTLSLRSLFNRYTLVAGLAVVLGTRAMLSGTGFYAAYRPTAEAYDAARAMDDVRWLAQPENNGRLSGSEDAWRVSEWLAQAFRDIGLQPSGEAIDSYYATRTGLYRDLEAMPTLVCRRGEVEVIGRYGVDFVRDHGPYEAGGTGAGELVLMNEPGQTSWNTAYLAVDYGVPVQMVESRDQILLELVDGRTPEAPMIGNSGLMAMVEALPQPERYELLAESHRTTNARVPQVLVTRAFVERLLEGSGIDLSSVLSKARNDLPVYVRTGWRVELSVPNEPRERQARDVIAIWPGEDLAYNREVVIVSAYYDGLGRLPDGTLYPGANDNASGVATLLEMARTLKEGDYKPKRTILFVAWCGGERHRPVDWSRFMKVRAAYAENWRVVASIEIDGVGAGAGNSAAVWHSNRQRLTRVVQQAAQRMQTPLTTVEAPPHADVWVWPAPPADPPGAIISWARSDAASHLPTDSADAVDIGKMAQVGRMTTLAVMVLAGDPAY